MSLNGTLVVGDTTLGSPIASQLTIGGTGSTIMGASAQVNFDLSTGAFTLDYTSLGLGGGLTASFDNGTGVLSIVAVPEPSRALLLLFGLMGVVVRRRRKL